jgi:hypothetical protein
MQAAAAAFAGSPVCFANSGGILLGGAYFPPPVLVR